MCFATKATPTHDINSAGAIKKPESCSMKYQLWHICHGHTQEMYGSL